MSNPSDASRLLIRLARRNVRSYLENPLAKSSIVMGSAAEGISDFMSDLDMAVYYEELPSLEELQRASRVNAESEVSYLSTPTKDAALETYMSHGVDCQVAHLTITGWEREMASVLEDLNVEGAAQKALSGMQHAVALSGEGLVREWKDLLKRYPPSLAEVMVNHYLSFSPMWAMPNRYLHRDGLLWIHENLLRAGQNILGVLAGLNRVYYSTFQFKRMQTFIEGLHIKPDHLHERLEAMITSEPAEAIHVMEGAVRDTVKLVDEHMPELDTSRSHRYLEWKVEPWSPFELDGRDGSTVNGRR